MYFHGMCFSNLWQWYEDPFVIGTTSMNVLWVIGQEVINGIPSADSCLGVKMTTAFLHLWHVLGIVHTCVLMFTVSTSMEVSRELMLGAYFRIHVHLYLHTVSNLTLWHVWILLGVGCVWYSGHKLHVIFALKVFMDIGVLVHFVPTLVSST